MSTTYYPWRAPKESATATAHGSWIIFCPEDKSRASVEPAPPPDFPRMSSGSTNRSIKIKQRFREANA